MAERIEEFHAERRNLLDARAVFQNSLAATAALRRTPMQAAVGVAVRLANMPMEWSVRRADRALQAVRNTRPTFENLMKILRWIGGDPRTDFEDVVDRTVPGARYI